MTTPEEHYITYDIVSHPKSDIAVVAMTDSWIWCVNGDPTKAVVYTGENKKLFSIQGNSDRRIAQTITPNVGKIELVFVEKFFKPYEIYE